MSDPSWLGSDRSAVDPGVQNHGVGRLLMLALMERARERGFAGVRLLQSAFHNRSLSLYSKLGFDAKEPMSVMHGLPLRVPLAGCDVRPATLEDVEEASRICERVHGFSRAGELRESVSQGSALVVSRHGRITGYAAGFGYFGHAVGESNVDMKALIGAAENVERSGVIIPTRNADLFRWCLSQGMRVLHPMTLMSIGLYSETRRRLFAIGVVLNAGAWRVSRKASHAALCPENCDARMPRPGWITASLYVGDELWRAIGRRRWNGCRWGGSTSR